MAMPGPETLRAGCLDLSRSCISSPASPSRPFPHLVALLQVPQHLIGFGVSVSLMLLGHLWGPLLDTCYGHPGEMLPHDGAALLGAGTLRLWPHKSPYGCHVEPSVIVPLGMMSALVTKAWLSPWRDPRLCEGTPQGTQTHKPTAGHG